MNIEEVTKGLTQEVGREVRGMMTGERIDWGDGYQRVIDKRASDLSKEYMKELVDDEKTIAMGGENEGWIDAYSRNRIDSLKDYDFAFLMDFVEGTKNADKRKPCDVYTTALTFKPEVNKIVASSSYRWDDKLFFYDGDESKVNGQAVEAIEVNEIDDRVKIHGIPIFKYVASYGEIADFFVEEFDLDERDHPTLKSDGTTTSSLIATVMDKSIDVDPRALFEDSKRSCFTHDLAPAAAWVKNLGVEIYDFDGEEVEIDPRKDEAISYVALPPGELRGEIRERLPRLKERLLEGKG